MTSKAASTEKITPSSTTTTMTLGGLPTKVLESILTQYCDGYTLAQFWVAVVGCKETWRTLVQDDSHQQEQSARDYFKDLLEKIGMERVEAAEKEDKKHRFKGTRVAGMIGEMEYVSKNMLDEKFSDEHGMDGPIEHRYGETNTMRESWERDADEVEKYAVWTLRFSLLFFVTDYAAEIPLNFVWGSRLQFREPTQIMRQSGRSSPKTVEANVMLVAQNLFSAGIQSGREWQLAMKDAAFVTIKGDGNLPGYTATPVVLKRVEFDFDGAAYGRIVGVTSADRAALKQVSEWMAQDNLAAVFSKDFHAPNRYSDGTSLTFHIRSHQQAEQTVNRFIHFFMHPIRSFMDLANGMLAGPPLQGINAITSGGFDANSNESSLFCASYCFSRNQAGMEGFEQQIIEGCKLSYRNYKRMQADVAGNSKKTKGW